MVETEDSRVGLDYFFKTGMLEQMLDFILGEKSPITGKIRISMGSSYSPPNFGALMKVITKMIG